jgi:hypothetical protein
MAKSTPWPKVLPPVAIVVAIALAAVAAWPGSAAQSPRAVTPG